MESFDGSPNLFDNFDRVNPSQDKTSNPRTTESYSLFGDTSCGEPLITQQIQLDFTPDEEIDNEYVQKKCCDFWNFIESQPQIRHLMVLPEKQNIVKSPELTESTSETYTSDIEETGINRQKTALSMLEFVEEKGLIDRTFEAKMEQSQCTLGSREYKELTEITQKKKSKTTCQPCQLYHSILGDPSTCGPCSCIVPKLSPLKAMVKKMQDWDDAHPKSMEPPGHPPSLQHCILQRRAEP